MSAKVVNVTIEVPKNSNIKYEYDRKTGKIAVDRILYGPSIYPENYGFIPNTISGDGEELDAYVLGEDKPLETFEGRVIAVIHRLNDDDDKLVVVKDGKQYSNEQIDALVEFQEQWFEYEIIR